MMRAFRTTLTRLPYVKPQWGENAMNLDNLLSLVYFGVLVLFNSIVGQTQPRFYPCPR